ncbi:MAG: hypothetical protein RRC34_06980 [Lentisphaeria bacterium]|nr:hypothetical protein [Lentisphaeria bacterium]
MLRHVHFSDWLPRVIAILCLCAAAAVYALDVDASLEKADKLLAAGDSVAALELYSKCAGAAPDNAVAAEGMKQAKNAIRQQMGDVSAARLTKMLTRLDEIDAERVKHLSNQVVTLEKERDIAAAQVTTLEGKLAAVRTDPAIAKSEAYEQVQKELDAVRKSESAAQKTLTTVTRELEQIKLDRQADQRAAAVRIEELVAENQKNADEMMQVTAALNAAQAQTQTMTAKLAAASAEVTSLTNRIAAVTAENARLMAEKDTLVRRLNTADAPVQELAAAKAENVALMEKNQALTAALRKAEATPAPRETPSLEALALKSHVAKMEAELNAANMENARLSAEVDRLRQEAAAAKKRALPTPPATPVTTTVGDAEKALQDLRAGLNNLESDIPRPVDMPELKPAPVTQSRKFKKSVKKLTRDTEDFCADVSEANTFAETLKEAFADTPDTIENRLREMDAMQAQADINLGALKKRLRETEALTAGGAE